MTSKQAYQVSNERDYRAMVENFSIDQLQAHIKQHESELQGNGEMAEYAGPYDASPSDYEDECQEIEAYLAIDREVLASKQAASQKWVIEESAPIALMDMVSEQPAKPAKKARAKKADAISGEIDAQLGIARKPAKKSKKAAVTIEAPDEMVSIKESAPISYEEIQEPMGVMDSAISDLEDEISALWGMSIQARSEQIQKALFNRLQSEAVMEEQEKRAASDAIEAIALADSIPCYDAPLEELQDEMAALHEENPLTAPSEEEMENMALALQPSEGIFWLVKDEEEEEEYIDLPGEPEDFTDEDFTSLKIGLKGMNRAFIEHAISHEAEPLTDRDFTQFVEKLEVMAESPASKAGKAKKASKPEKASNGQFWDNAYDGQLASNQVMYEGPCDLPEGFKIPADRAVMVTPEKGRIRYNLYGRIAECPGLWFKYGNIGGYWKAYRLADLQKWIEDRAGKEPFLMKEPNIPAAKMGMVLPKPEKPAKPEKVTLPAGDISIKRADQKAMMAELRLLRHVNEINAYVSFGILPELTLEDSKAFKVMQAYLDSEKIWLFGFNEGEQASKDPYYAIEASEGQLNTLCEIFQIKRA